MDGWRTLKEEAATVVRSTSAPSLSLCAYACVCVCQFVLYEMMANANLLEVHKLGKLQVK